MALSCFLEIRYLLCKNGILWKKRQRDKQILTDILADRWTDRQSSTCTNRQTGRQTDIQKKMDRQAERQGKQFAFRVLFYGKLGVVRFLVGCTRLYTLLCPSVRPSVRPLVGLSVGPSHFYFFDQFHSLKSF